MLDFIVMLGRYLSHIVRFSLRHPIQSLRTWGTVWPIYWSMWKLQRAVRQARRLYDLSQQETQTRG